ncbi:NYN domain-containing protein [Kribbella sp. GL6]|uniref:NYN domain-containing protein n=1 Tax=Kribbella sp. GL6 TaxID=3419765 RepID=UPI003D008E92
MDSEPTQVIVVDAANVIGSRPDGWWRDRAGAARRLLTRLSAFQAQSPDTTVIVVLEGAARQATSGDTAPTNLEVVLAPGSGDDTIVAVTQEAATRQPHPTITVVTADRALRDRLTPTGATPTGPNWLLSQLDALPQRPSA